MALRPTTNLIVPQELMLGRQEQKQKFLYVYTGAYKGSPTTFMTKLWASVLFPSVINDPKFGSARPRFTADELSKVMPAGYLKVQKIKDPKEPYFLASVPLFSFMRNSTGGISNFLNGVMRNWRSAKQEPTPEEEHLQELRDMQDLMGGDTMAQFGDEVIPAQRVIEAMKLDNIGTLALQQTLRQVRIQTKGSLAVIFADFKISKEEAQQLTTTPWIELRDIDIYPLLMHWVTVGFGARGVAPTASFSVSKIAFSLPPEHVEDARVNTDGISIGPDGKPYFLPRQIDKSQTLSYEDAYTQAGAREDGSFALLDIDEGAKAMESGKEVQTRLPKNTVVSIDWLNNKYAYTDGSGFLKVTDLTRFRKADASHIRQLLDYRALNEGTMAWFFNMGAVVGVKEDEFVVLPQDFETVSPFFRSQLERSQKNIRQWLTDASNAFMDDTGATKVTYGDLRTNGYPPFAPIVRWLARVESAVSANIGVVYNKYTVTTVSSQFAWLLLIIKYADKIYEVRAEDEKKRLPATSQGVDPQWSMPSVPLVSTHMGPDHDQPMGLLPHQLKVQNILKDDPDVAILPIQAGGGKTPSLLIDLLLKFKADTDAPYLVLCPAHLVPNYVRETVYFTEGKLNVIALTNLAIRQNGWKRLQEIFEAMPRNTVVVADLDYALAFRRRSVSYGTTPTTIFPTIDFLRQFKFGYVAIDEAHRIKGKTGRNASVMALISDIPKKRLASGTFVHDSPSDLARIIGALDPTIFGTRDEFNTTYGEPGFIKGDRVVKWKPGAERAIMAKIKEHIVVAGAMRKEWAAFLPTKVEWVGGVELTHAQQAVYEDILNETIERIQEDSKTNAALQSLLSSKKPVPEGSAAADAEDEDAEKVTDENEGEDLAGMLNAYLERLESFLVAPGSDDLGSKILKGSDLISPKVNLVYDRIRLHLKGGEIDVPVYEELTDEQRRAGQEPQITGWKKAPYGPFPGKVLVFCNSHKAADAIFDNAPPDLKASGVLYKASDKVEALSKMEKDNRALWMVGIVKSMEEGLNLQFASRVIRVSSPWNPGSLEQSNSRIERPEFKKAETRSKIFFDSIVANHTYDITKQARLIAKVLAAAKFENAESPAYQTIPDLEVVPMNLDTIREFNSWDGMGTEENPGLKSYLVAQRRYEKVRNKDYADYKAKYIADHGEGPVMTEVVQAPTPKDAKMLKIVPYVAGLGIYKEDELGLKRVDEYLNIAPQDEEGESDSGDQGDAKEDQVEEVVEEIGKGGKILTPQQIEMRQKLDTLIGHLVHTEYGEGYIKKINTYGKGQVQVELLNGYAVVLRRSQVYLVTRTLTNNKDIKVAINKEIGLPIVDNKPSVPADMWKPSKFMEKQHKALKEQEKKVQEKVLKEKQTKKAKDMSVELYVLVTNGYLGIDYLMDENNETAAKILQASGFRTTQPYYYSKVVNKDALNRQMKLWKDSGLMVDKQMMAMGVREAFIEMYNLLSNGQIKNHKETFRAAQQNRVVNFYKQENKPSNDKATFKPYPLIQDGAAYIALPVNQASSKIAMQHKRPSFRWVKSDPALTYFGTMQQVLAKLNELQADGLQIANIKDLEAELHKMKVSKMQIRDPKEDLM